MDDIARAKQAAGRRAVGFVEDGMTLGLGTGSTVRPFLDGLAERIRAEGLVVRGVPTSEATAAIARELGIPLATLAEVESIDVTVDGADEIDGQFAMIKGGGGALLREKVVARLTAREVVVVDPAKVVERLGTTFRLPVEVVPFAVPVIERTLRHLGLEPSLRGAETPAGGYRTDNGNAILDCHVPGGISDPAGLERELASLPGVVESGLFVGLAHVLVIGRPDGTSEVRERT
ncbi:Ribose-5-phosphate isomerase A [Planctomycetes bacterium Pla163]|uniref:Ribose-5-phosphate isomerase A n=1 Tax=Rohdeia mirabilis TaxID=2528008 RepID=A0A518D528_9BACT|nr:Ribose-5-phosphate isomerase A [Planctomycetes bacterium Pla163]